MKKLSKVLMTIAVICLVSSAAWAQEGKIVSVAKLHLLWPEDGSQRQRDSLISIYVSKVIRNNALIVSHMELTHWWTSDSRDYLVIETFNKFEDIAKANDMNAELEKKAWPDEKQRKAFMDAMNKYFENWHGDMLMREVPGATK